MNCNNGCTHRLGLAFQISNCPTGSGTVAELYPNGQLPPVLLGLLHDLVWCDVVNEYAEIANPERVVLTPTEGW